MRRVRKRTVRKVIQVFDFGETDDLGWVRKNRKRSQNRRLIFKLFKLLFIDSWRYLWNY